LGLLRLAIATDPDGHPNRYVCETLFRHVWEGGGDAADAQRLEALTAQLAPARDPRSDEVKQELSARTADALAQGVFGVPSYQVDDKVMWGLDALPMLRAYLEDPQCIDDAQWAAVKDLPFGITRNKA
jgi:2-hydroxychromene-2-carboxylate isomerase